MLTLTDEYQLKPTQEEAREIERVLEVCCQVWNYALRQRNDRLNSRKCRVGAALLVGEYIIPPDESDPNYSQQRQSLTAKKTYPQLTTVNTPVFLQVLRRSDVSSGGVRQLRSL